MNRFTENLMTHFPSWMKLSKDPDSVGAQFLSVFGLTLDDFEAGFNDVIENFYLTTADTEIIDWLYKIPLETVRVDDAESVDHVFITYSDGRKDMVFGAENLRMFYHRQARIPSYFIDRPGGYLYLRTDLDLVDDWDNPFQALEINEANHYDLILHPVWNLFDEFGLLLGLNRLPRERNAAYKERILSVFKTPGTVTQTGVKEGLARELGIDPSEIDINSLSDSAFQESLMLPDGTPSVQLMRYAKKVNETLKFTWDTMNFGEAYWFSIEQDHLAIDYLPHVWDVDTSGFKKTDFQSGVGSGDDLFVHAPVEEDSFRSVTVSIGLMGYLEEYETIHPEITFTYRIYAEGEILEQEYQEQAFRYTVKGTEVFDQAYRVQADADFQDTITPNLSSASGMAAGGTPAALHFGKSTDFLHDQRDRMLRLSVQLNKFPNGGTPEITSMGVVWEDTTGQEHTFPFNTEDHWLIDRSNSAGNPMTNSVYSDVAHDGTLTLGYGAFHDEIDRTEEWRTGTWEVNNIKIDNGAIRLNLDRFNPPGVNGPRY